MWDNEYKGDYKEWPTQELIQNMDFQTLLNLRIKTIEWEFGNSPHTGNDVIVRMRFTLNSGHQSPIFGMPKTEVFPCKFDFKNNQFISAIKVYCYGCYGFEFFD